MGPQVNKPGGFILNISQLCKFSLASTPANLLPNAHEWVSKSFWVLCPREVNHSYSPGETKAIICIFATGTLLVSAGHLPVLSWCEKGKALPFLSHDLAPFLQAWSACLQPCSAQLLL